MRTQELIRPTLPHHRSQEASSIREGGLSAATAPPSIVHSVLKTPGKPLDSASRVLMESRFGHRFADLPAQRVQPQVTSKLAIGEPGDRFEQEADRMSDLVMREQPAARRAYDFSKVRIHTDAQAAESARAAHSHAYTVGDHIVFGTGKHSPGTDAGQRLLAHELTHVVQQTASPAEGRLMRKWDDAPDCGKAKDTDKWIKTVTVNQEGSQTATIEWSDGSLESDQCSAGKGHCCVDASNSNGVAATVEASHADGSNCTPITQKNGYPVKNRVLDHSGVAYWTEFEPNRSIALHEYTPIDGSPLSHGCVRLHTEMAKKIFCGVRQNQTWVKVLGFARPKCDNSNLQSEWLNDFKTGAMAKPDGITTASEIAETRRELNAAFGRTLTAAEIGKFTVADIPRCKNSAPLPKPVGSP